MRRMPEVISDRAAVVFLDGKLRGLDRARSQTLACGTIYLTEDVRELKRTGQIKTRRRMPELMGAKEAAACLGVKGPNLYKTDGVDAVPQQQTTRGVIYLAAGIRRLQQQRAAPPPPWTCPRHGDEDVRTSSTTGKPRCAVCERERKRALLADSVRRAEYNRRRRELYQKQRETEVAA